MEERIPVTLTRRQVEALRIAIRMTQVQEILKLVVGVTGVGGQSIPDTVGAIYNSARNCQTLDQGLERLLATPGDIIDSEFSPSAHRIFKLICGKSQFLDENILPYIRKCAPALSDAEIAAVRQETEGLKLAFSDINSRAPNLEAVMFKQSFPALKQ